MRTITITGYKRPALFGALLESLLRNSLDGWKIYVQVEPTEHAAQYEDIARRMLAGQVYDFSVNPVRLGVRQNPYALLDKVFMQGATVNIYLEEDMTVAADLTRLALWYEARHRPEWMCLSLLSAGCGGLGFLSFPEHSDLFFPSKAFNSLGFIARRDEWTRYIRPAWGRAVLSDCRLDGGIAGGWDYAVYHALLRQDGLFSLQSVAARALHTGRDGGVNCKPEWHDLAFDGAELPAGNADGYRVLSLADLPAPVRRQALLWDQAHIALLALSVKEQGLRRLGAALRILACGLIVLGVALTCLAWGHRPYGAFPFFAAIFLADAGILGGLAVWLRRRSKIKWVMGK